MTTKEELQKQINELKSKMVETQKEIDKLQELIDKPENVRCNVRWRAEKGKGYYYLDAEGVIRFVIDNRTHVDDFRWRFGNYFESETKTKKHRANLFNKQRLKDLALRLNNGVEIDWEYAQQDKYYIFFDYEENELNFCLANKSIDIGQVYCLDRNFLDLAVKEIGKQALIKLIKSGV